MKLNVDFSGIVRARESIGAPLGMKLDFRRIEEQLSPIKLAFLETGYVLLSADELRDKLVFVGGVPSIENQPVTLHIYQPHSDIDELQSAPCVDGPKYHFYDCKTLENMRSGGRFNRYVATARTEGVFAVQPKNKINNKWGDEINAKLLPCRNCISSVNYNNYSGMSSQAKIQLVQNFPVDEMLESFKPIFRCMPLYDTALMPQANYSNDWPKISIQTRQNAKWFCDCCGVRLEEKIGKGLLHVHHRDGIRGNNRPSNLRVLCAECHKQQPFHGHMHLLASDLSYLLKKREEQGLKTKCVACS